MNRRTFLKFLMLSLASFTMPLRAYGEFYDVRLSQFTSLSKRLTGFDQLDPILAEQYLELLDHKFGERFNAMLVNLPVIIIKTDIMHLYQQEEEMITSLLELWYLGSLDDKTVSAKAYQQSFIWTALAVEAPGVCGQFGDWENPPLESTP